MPAFGKQLQAAELAAVITYTRNALGNSKGDDIQAKDINALMGGSAASSTNTDASKKESHTNSKPAENTAAAEHTAKPASKPKNVSSQDEEVDSVQFAQDKFYPQKRFDDKAGTAKPESIKKSQTTAAKGESTLADLVKKGESVYENSCQSCHQPGGVGMPPVFPALKGSPVVTGKIDAQVDIMLKGKGMMPAFGKTLDAADFAAVLAYSRNKLNATGDFKQPSEIEALQ